MKVFTYYSPVQQMGVSEQSALLAIWKRAWQRAGWEPVVLSARDAEKHPRYKHAELIFSGFPSVNPKNYEMACWLRWVAMARHGGVMVDYDVVPYGFAPDDIPLNDGHLVSILADNNPCPCAVHGTRQQFENTVEIFLGSKLLATDIEHGDRPHLSDQNLLQRLSEKFRPHIYDMCPEYRSRHWKEAKLVHYCHAATAGHDRLQLMRGPRA